MLSETQEIHSMRIYNNLLPITKQYIDLSLIIEFVQTNDCATFVISKLSKLIGPYKIKWKVVSYCINIISETWHFR